ncbi:MAG: tetratricopeptide repeat protein [Brevinematales bacterium]|nr:tetratricopeptide repeat protein [Brevinematales bacterium]
MRTRWVLGLILLSAVTLQAQTVLQNKYKDDAKAYVIYNQANEFYRNNDFASAKSTYLKMIQTYSESGYVPYALYMLSFIETDYLKIIDYLNYIRTDYTDFKYWANAMEKLGDILYVVGDFATASEVYESSKTEKAYYMLGVIYSAQGEQEKAIQAIEKLLYATKNYELAYKGLLVQSKACIDLKKYGTALNVLQEAVKLKKWSFDNGVRVLFYAAKSFFYRKEYGKALHVFSILIRNMPLSAEAQLSKNYLTYLENNNIIKDEPVDWVDYYFVTPAELAYKGEQADLHYDMEVTAEKTVGKAESIQGQVVKSEVLEYVVRVGEYKDLSVANVIAKEIAKNQKGLPIGIYYRNDLYYAEIRGITKLEDAKSYAKLLISIGYKDTKVVEMVKVTEYGEQGN